MLRHAERALSNSSHDRELPAITFHLGNRHFIGNWPFDFFWFGVLALSGKKTCCHSSDAWSSHDAVARVKGSRQRRINPEVQHAVSEAELEKGPPTVAKYGRDLNDSPDIGADNLALRIPFPLEHERPETENFAAYQQAKADAIGFVNSLMKRHEFNPHHLVCDVDSYGPEMARVLLDKERILSRIRALIVNFDMTVAQLGWKSPPPSKTRGPRKVKRRRER